MKTRITLITAAVASLFVGIQPAMAVSATHESEWDKIKLCANVTVASDSTDSWGCWTELAPTAAGPSPGVGLLGMPGGDAYRNIPDYTLPQTPAGCPEGAACGYAVFRNFGQTDGPVLFGWGGEGFGRQEVYPATMIVYPTIGEPEGNWSGWWPFLTYKEEGDLSLNFTLTKMQSGDPDPMFTESGDLEGGYTTYPYGSWFPPRLPDTTYFDAGRKDDGGGAYIEGMVDGHLPWTEANAVAVGDELDSFKIYVYMYTNGEATLYNGDNGWSPMAGVKGAYVVGFPTSLANMAALQNLVAFYHGNEVLSGARVDIGVNFNTATWGGTWNSHSLPDWSASGTISGANIQSTALGGAAVSGGVQGTFYGASAQNLAGVSDVMLQPDVRGIRPSEPFRHVDLFVTKQVFTAPADGDK